MIKPSTVRLQTILTSMALVTLANANVAEDRNYSPYADRSYPENVYWGDTHVHTSRSFDAYSRMNRLDPEIVYRFAKGETVISHSGQKVRIGKPLDFLVVTDHAEYTGVLLGLDVEDPELLQSGLGKRWHELYQSDKRQQVLQEIYDISIHGKQYGSVNERFRRPVWKEIVDQADKHYAPGKFTAFIGYEWSSTPGFSNLHRNVIFRDGANNFEDILPFSSLDSYDPEDLWDWMENYEKTTGGKVLAIPHNGNMSNGEMFIDKTFSRENMTLQYAETRSRWEPLYEMTQFKGDGETHPYLSPDDGFADFETWDFLDLADERRNNSMLQFEYARSALKMGLSLESQLGANPFKFGMIGSTDAHTSFAEAGESSFLGKYAIEEPTGPGRAGKEGLVPGIEIAAYAASGYAAVWASENSREAIFDAMRRKETYATTGPRIRLRFFAGWDFEQGNELRPDYVDIGYRKGVPMGADLINAPEGQSPDFIVVASKDPDGANLDRIQIVKGWLASDGQTHEKVYNVAVSDDRRILRNGSVRPLQHTVDLDTATYFNSIGEATLATTWTDPDFEPDQRAFYYVRVLEIPTPRWTTYDSVFFNEPRPEEVPAIIQERAYSSPIWYTP